MADKYIISKDKLKAIADAVRSKTGETGTLTADQMASKIAGISAGGNGDMIATQLLIDGPSYADMIINYDAVTYYRKYCFCETKSIKSISDSNVRTISDFAFYNCDILSVDFPNVSKIGGYALNNTYLQKINLPNCIDVRGHAISSKAQLADVRIGTSVENESVYLSEGALRCSSDAVVTLGGEKCNRTTFGGTIIDHAKEVIVYKPYAFYGADNVTAFIFPQTLSYAPSAENLSRNSWYYVPADMLEAFKAATNWATVSDRIRPLTDLALNRLAITGSAPNVYAGHASFKAIYNDGCYIRGDDYKGVTYTLSSNISLESSSPDGITVALNNVKAGDTITITATSTKDPSISTTATFTAVYKGPSITVTTTQWDDTGSRMDGALTNVYMSNEGSYHISNGRSLAKVVYNGYQSVTVAIRSYAENSYDYVTLSALDYDGTFDRNSDNVLSTKGKQSSDTYIDYTYTADDEEHYFYVLYSKDSSGDHDDDRGYFYIKEAA